MHNPLCSSIATILMICGASAAEVESPFRDAVAAWHMADLKDSAGKESRLTPGGKVTLGVELKEAERAASIARGGDGRVARCDAGWLSAGQGTGGELNLTGSAMTMGIRLRDPSGQWNTSLFSKFGSHDRLVYNLFTVELGSGMVLGFELGVAGRPGMVQVKVPVGRIGPDKWHDVVVRYDGKKLELFVDGTLHDAVAISGQLRGGNTEPCLIGAHPVNQKALRPFRGMIDHAALWGRALKDEEIASLCGVKTLEKKAAVRKTPVVRPDPSVDRNVAEPVRRFREVVRSTDVATFSKAALALRRYMIENDPHRPVYHFTGPESWINDPNGVIYHQGKYHLFYQFDPIVEGRRSKRCWGHAVSDDLVHWVDWPVAIWPDSPHDRGGVYSGNMTIDDEGNPAALYTGNVAGHRETYGMLARSTDGFRTWQKKMVMDNKQRPNPQSPVHWDAQVWKEGDTWQQLIGGTTGGNGAQGCAWLWTSPDLENWTLQKHIAPSIKLGRYWELPYLLPFGEKHALLVGHGNPYWVGVYDKEKKIFTPDYAQPKSMDPGTYYSFNPHMTDDKGPGGSTRRLMHGWVTGAASPTKTVPYWQSAHSIPRVLTVRGEYLVQTPVLEIEVLRGKHVAAGRRTIEPDKGGYVPDVRGDALEIVAAFDPARSKAARFGLKVRMSPDGKQFARIWYDPAAEQFGVDGNVAKKTSTFGGITSKRSEETRLRDPVTLRVFIDRSILEVYCGGNAITNRMFLDSKCVGVDLFAEGGPAQLVSLDAWQMKSMWSPGGDEGQRDGHDSRQ